MFFREKVPREREPGTRLEIFFPKNPKVQDKTKNKLFFTK
jgi:hypothetical protein